MNRRGFLASMLALAAAPAIVRAQSLMPIRPLVRPTLAETMAIQGLNWSSTSFDAWAVVLYDAAGNEVVLPFDAKPLVNGDTVEITSATRDLVWLTDRDVTLTRIGCRPPQSVAQPLGRSEFDIPMPPGGDIHMAQQCNLTMVFPKNNVLTLTR